MHAARTAVAATVSLAVAGLVRMPEAYWAPVSTMIVMQSTLGASWSVSKKRLAGTVLGGVFGGLVATFFRPSLLVFGASIFALGLVCAALRLHQSAYRFSGIALAIIVLVARGVAPFVVAVHRCIEVSIGILVALALAAVWPGRELAGDSP